MSDTLVRRPFPQRHSYPVLGLEPADWPLASLQGVDFRKCVATQAPAYSPCGITRKRLGEPPRGGNPYAYILVVEDVWYIVDGHTRIAMRLRAGYWWGLAYVLHWPGRRCSDHCELIEGYPVDHCRICHQFGPENEE